MTRPLDVDVDLGAFDDHALMQRVVGGDRSAFTVLIERHRDRVFGHLQRMLGPHDAEDVAQATYLRVWRSCQRFDPQFSLSNWIMVIATRLALNHLRDQRPRPQTSTSSCDQAIDPTPPESPVIEADERAHHTALLEDALRQLEPRARLLYELRYRQELGLAEIAAHLGSNRNAIKQRLHRLKRALIEAVGPESS